MTKDDIWNAIFDKELVEGLTAEKGVEGGKFLVPHGKVAMGDKVHGKDELVSV